MTPHRRNALALTALVLALASCDPFNTGFEEAEAAVLYRASHPDPDTERAPAGTIRVMTYNVKYGGARLRFFWECDGSRYLMTEGEVNAHLDALAALIRAVDPDVVLLQEVDTWRSKRVAYVDEVQGLLDRVALNYGAYASAWKADYVPTDGLGPVDSGNAILSRWPITRAVRHALALQTDISWLDRYFYLKRNMLEARLEVPTAGEVAVVDLHAEAFSQDGTKKKHLDAFKALLDGIDAEGVPVVGGGDFNAIPRQSPIRQGFPEDAGCTGGRFEPDSYVGEEDWLDAIDAGYFWDMEGAPASDFSVDACVRCTFVGDERFPLNRKLDHLFTNGTFASTAAADTVIQSSPSAVPPLITPPILASDHVPVVVDWDWVIP